MIDIKWDSFLIVAGVVLLTTVVLTTFYASGVRLLGPRVRRAQSPGSGPTPASRSASPPCCSACG